MKSSIYLLLAGKYEGVILIQNPPKGLCCEQSPHDILSNPKKVINNIPLTVLITKIQCGKGVNKKPVLTL